MKGAYQYYRPVLIPSRDVRGTQSQKMWYNKLLNRIQSFDEEASCFNVYAQWLYL